MGYKERGMLINSFEINKKVIKSQNQKKSRGRVIIIFLSLILVIAAVKNPSENESKEMINNYLVEKFNNKLTSYLNQDDSDTFKQLGAFLGMKLAPQILDYISETRVNDYIVFSTFECITDISDYNKTIVSGIILFGKIIPLDTDLDV